VGAPAPGFPEGQVFSSLGHPAIGRNGHLAFAGMAAVDTASGTPAQGAVWAGRPGQIELLVRDGDPVVGAPADLVFRTGGGMIVSSSGHVALQATMRNADGGGNVPAVLAHVNGETRWIVRVGDVVATTAGNVTVAGIDSFAFSDAGMTLAVTMTGDLGSRGLLHWDFERLSLLASSRLPLPTHPGCAPAPGQSFSEQRPSGLTSPLLINDAGDIVFAVGIAATVAGASCPSHGVFRWRAGAWSTVVEAGQPVPQSVGLSFGAAYPRHVNDLGGVTFNAWIGNRASSWYSPADGGMQRIALEGEALPDGSGWHLSMGPFFNASNVSTMATMVNNTGRAVLRAPWSPVVGGVSAGWRLQRGLPRAASEPIDLDNPGVSQLAVVGPDPGSGIGGVGVGRLDNAGNLLFQSTSALWHLDPDGNAQPILAAIERQDYTLGSMTFRVIGPQLADEAFHLHGVGSGLPAQYSDTRQIVTRAVIDEPPPNPRPIVPRGDRHVILLTSF